MTLSQSPQRWRGNGEEEERVGFWTASFLLGEFLDDGDSSLMEEARLVNYAHVIMQAWKTFCGLVC